MFTIPNQSSLAKAWTQFTSLGRLMPSDNRDHLVDVCEELVKVTSILRLQFDLLRDWFSERKERSAYGKRRTQAEK
jgi:arsenical resistance protein ArsH